MKVGVAVDQDKLLRGLPCFFIFSLTDSVVHEQGLNEVAFEGPSVLKTGKSIIGVRAWIEAELDSIRSIR